MIARPIILYECPVLCPRPGIEPRGKLLFGFRHLLHYSSRKTLKNKSVNFEFIKFSILEQGIYADLFSPGFFDLSFSILKAYA